MPLPLTNRSPAFTVTRISHVVLHVNDLEDSRSFYEGLIGLVVTEMDSDAVYLRGVEEMCHHSLVLRKTNARPLCERIGFRVREEDDLDRAKAFFARRRHRAEFVDAPHQGRTLQVSDEGRVPLEFCAHMPTQPRQALLFSPQQGAAATRLDHVQTHVTDVPAAAAFYADLGFRVSEYASEDGTEDTPFRSIFLGKKGNANDIVLLSNDGPRLHHTAFVVHDAASTLLRVCDDAIGMHMRDRVEWGPNRHGLGNERFLYLRDPDGHRVELLSSPYQFVDLEETPFGWSTLDANVANLWGPPPPQSWRDEATPFAGVAVESPAASISSRQEPGRTALPA